MVSLTRSQNTATRRGDTLVEVMFSITVFALIAVISINLMNSGVNTAQTALEVTMARNEIDAQAEALRFIQNSYLAEREFNDDDRRFDKLWHEITNVTAHSASESAEIVQNFTAINNCSEVYSNAINNRSFVLNTRHIQPEVNAYDNKSYSDLLGEIVVLAQENGSLVPTTLYPRIIYGGGGNDNEIGLQEGDLYRTIISAQGIWVITVRSNERTDPEPPEFYDFYVRTCWHASGRNVPSTIGTVVRLYNPEIIE